MARENIQNFSVHEKVCPTVATDVSMQEMIMRDRNRESASPHRSSVIRLVY